MNSDLKINLNNLNILRFVAILLVVLRHSFAPYLHAWDISHYYQSNRTVEIIGEYISTFSMPLFVFISGFIYAYLRLHKNKYSTFSILIKKKSRRLLIPYFVFGVIYIAVFMEYNSLLSFIKPLWFGCGHLWFILMIYLIFVFFYPLENFFKNNIIIGILISIVCFMLAPVFNFIGFDPLRDVSFYFIFFYIGYLFCLRYKSINNFIRTKSLMFLGIHGILFIITILFFREIENKYLNILVNNLVKIPLGIMAICFSFGYFRTFTPNKIFNNLILAINKNSYYIYLFHQPVLMILFGLSVFQSFSTILVILLGFTISLTISLIMSELALKNSLSRALIGAK